jgi:hypothetical protein
MKEKMKNLCAPIWPATIDKDIKIEGTIGGVFRVRID